MTLKDYEVNGKDKIHLMRIKKRYFKVLGKQMVFYMVLKINGFKFEKKESV